MSIYEKIKGLCSENNVTITGLERELGFSRGSLCKIDTHKPSAEKIRKIEDYFKLQAGWLNGTPEVEKIKPKLDEQQQRLLSYYNALNNLGKDKILDYVGDLVASGNYSASSDLDFLLPVAAHHSSYKDISEEDSKHDLDLLKDDDI